MKERLQKLFSAVCSRREAEQYIAAGRVTVNGHIATMGQRADPFKDKILLDGKPLPSPDKLIYILLNKPRGYVTTLSDEYGRKTVAHLVRDCGVRVYPVGRLDIDSEGLLIMTNDGALTNRLLHPSKEVKKIYHVHVSGMLTDAPARLHSLTKLDNGESIHPAEVKVLFSSETSMLLSITIHEGKNRQIRRMCQMCGLEVKRLRRVREHTLELGNLKLGTWRYLQPEEVEALREI